MSRSNLTNCFRWQFVVLLLLTGGIGCGGGGGTGSSSSTTGTVSILFTDGPSEDFTQIFVTIDDIELRGGEGGPVSVSGTPAEPFDLLSLENFSQLFSVADVPAGTYNKVRLHISRIELHRIVDDPDPVVFSSNEEADPGASPLPANGKIDILAAPPLIILPGEALLVEIDIDADESIHIVETGNGEYRFRPVIRLRVVQADLTNRLSRVSGTIEELDTVTGTMEICDPARAMMRADGDSDVDSDSDSDSDRGCVDVDMLDTASIFDSSGNPAGVIDLGGSATVVGQFRVDDDDSDSDSDSDTVAVTNEDNDTDADSDSADSDADSDSDGGEHGLGSLVLDAVVVELGDAGTFTTLRGTIGSVLDSNNRFTFTGDDGTPGGTPWIIQLQTDAASMLLATRIFTRDEGETGTDAIQVGVSAEIDGVDMAPVLNAALIVIEPPAAE